MAPGIRATVSFDDPAVCPVVELSAAAEARIDSVSANVVPDDETNSVTEFTVDADVDADERFTPVFSHGSTHRYRITHDGDRSCPCACLGRFECPVERYLAEDGHLTLVFHAAGYDELQSVVGALREEFPGVDIERFVRAPAADASVDSVFVDRSKLTDRQLEALQTAYRMGYFERPRGANATEVAAALDIDPSTLREHLVAAQSKLLGDVL
jgi:predicted DNA binding protein